MIYLSVHIFPMRYYQEHVFIIPSNLQNLFGKTRSDFHIFPILEMPKMISMSQKKLSIVGGIISLTSRFHLHFVNTETEFNSLSHLHWLLSTDITNGTLKQHRATYFIYALYFMIWWWYICSWANWPKQQ